MHHIGRRLAITLALLAGSVGPASAAAADPPATVPGEVVVGFERQASAPAQARAREAVDADLRRQVAPDVQLLRVGDGTRAAIAELRRRPDVAFAEPNYAWHVAATPNDPYFAPQPNGYRGQMYLRSIDAPTAWNVSTGSTTTRVGVGDTGIDSTHPDLAVTGGGSDAQGHGTSVAGVLAARGNDGRGIAGTTWRSDLRAFAACDSAGVCRTADTAAAIDAARVAGVRVLNLSIASPAGSTPSQAVSTAITAASSTLVVTAAGNATSGAGRNVDAAGQASYPCNYTQANLVCVGGVGEFSGSTLSDDLAYAPGNVGPTSVDLAAPARQLYTTALGGSRYAYKSGTSFAAPQVAGVAALLLAKRPTATIAQVRQALLASVDALPALAGKNATGGRLDAGKALARFA